MTQAELQSCSLDGELQAIQLLRQPMAGVGGGAWELQYTGALVSAAVRSERCAGLEGHMPVPKEVNTADFVLSPMPGALLSVAVQPGDVVAEGAEIAVVEAMKMQNVLRAPRSGVVKAVHVGAGSTVSGDEVLVEFEPVTPSHSHVASPCHAVSLSSLLECYHPVL